jgi:hypothetical protein
LLPSRIAHLSITRDSSATYRFFIDEIALPTSVELVTYYGSGPNSCQLGTGGPHYAFVRCSDPEGAVLTGGARFFYREYPYTSP